MKRKSTKWRKLYNIIIKSKTPLKFLMTKLGRVIKSVSFPRKYEQVVKKQKTLLSSHHYYFPHKSSKLPKKSSCHEPPPPPHFTHYASSISFQVKGWYNIIIIIIKVKTQSVDCSCNGSTILIKINTIKP